MKPRSAQLKQQQAQSRRAKLEETAARVQQDVRYQQNRATLMQTSRFAQTNRATRNRDPNRGLITQAEWDELVEKHEDSGKGFRRFFLFAVITSLLLLSLFKYDEEFNLEVPQVESGKGFGEVTSPDIPSASTTPGMMTTSELEKHFETLGVQGRFREKSETAPASPSSTLEDLDKERRMDNFRVRKEVKAAFTKHQEQQGQLVHCGRSCETHNQQVQLAYNRLISQVDRELFGVLLDAKDTKSGRSTSPEELKKKYEEKRAAIMDTESDPESREMALEELKDAYDIIQDADARKYYLLYGAKPPEAMRHVRARHGGWGQEMALGTYKYHIIIMWLDFLHKRIGVWGETFVLLSIAVFLLSRLPSALKQSMQVLDDFEWQEQQNASQAAAANEE